MTPAFLFTGFIAIWLPIVFTSFFIKTINKNKHSVISYLILACLLCVIIYTYTIHIEYPINIYYMAVSAIFLIVILIRDFIIK